MNVLIVSTFDTKGGAARAAYRLHRGLEKIGTGSAMVVKEKYSHDPAVFPISPLPGDAACKSEAPGALKRIQTYQQRYNRGKRTAVSDTLFSTGHPGYHIESLDIVRWADIINLHWVAKFQSTQTLAALRALGKPVVWTLHDQNPFTGGCHYSAGCLQYKEDCRACPQLTGDSRRLPHVSLQGKREHLGGGGITVVSPSRWLAQEAKESRVFKEASVVTIPNAVDIHTFAPRDKAEAKQHLGIPAGTFTILAGAANRRPKRKGLAQFLEAMRHCLEDSLFKGLVREGKVLLLCFGHPAAEFEALSIPFKAFDHIESGRELCGIYSASDLFVLSSVEDNLPNTMVESMACGTPVVAFDTGGMPDMIADGITGRLVPFPDAKAMGEAIIQLTGETPQRRAMGQKARQLIEREFKPEDQARAYTRLFSSLLPGEYGNHSGRHPFPPAPGGCSLDLSFHHFFEAVEEK